MEQNDYMGFNLFYDIEDVDVRAWNRCMMYFNIFRDHGKEMADGYVRHLDDISRKQMNNMLDRIKKNTFSGTRREIQESV